MGAAGPTPTQRASLLKRTAIVAATAFLAVNLWTGAPLLALWVGAQAVGQARLSMTAVCVVVAVLAVLVFSMSLALAWLNREYDELIGRPSGERRLPWLRSTSGEEGIEEPGYGVGVTALERIVMVSVYLAVICFLLWFFLLAGAPTPMV